MARRKKSRTTRRRRSARIGAVAPRRRRSSGGGGKNTIMDALMVGGGLIAGQIISKQLGTIKALEDQKIRGAALAGLGILGGNFLPKNLGGIALGISASGIYTLAKELMPDTIAADLLDEDDDGLGALTPAQVDLIENMAVESELVSGDLDAEVSSTLGSTMDSDVMSTVTGMDDADSVGEDEEEDF